MAIDSDSHNAGYSSGLQPFQLPTGSNAQIGATWKQQDDARQAGHKAEEDARRASSSTSEVGEGSAAVAGGGGLILILLLIAPPFIPLGTFMYDAFSHEKASTGWILSIIGLIVYFVWLRILYTRKSNWTAALLTAAYLGITYGSAVAGIFKRSPDSLAICAAVIAALGGYLIGIKVGRRTTRSPTVPGWAGRCRAVAIEGSFIVCSALIVLNVMYSFATNGNIHDKALLSLGSWVRTIYTYPHTDYRRIFTATAAELPAALHGRFVNAAGSLAVDPRAFAGVEGTGLNAALRCGGISYADDNSLGKCLGVNSIGWNQEQIVIKNTPSPDRNTILYLEKERGYPLKLYVLVTPREVTTSGAWGFKGIYEASDYFNRYGMFGLSMRE